MYIHMCQCSTAFSHTGIFVCVSALWNVTYWFRHLAVFAMEVQVRVVFEAQGRFDNDCLYQRQIKASNREDFLPFIDMHAHAHTNTLQALVCESSGTAQVVHFIKMLQQRTSFVSLGLCSLVSSSKVWERGDIASTWISCILQLS